MSGKRQGPSSAGAKGAKARRTRGTGAKAAANGGSAEADVPPMGGKTVATVLGEIVWLMSQSAEHKQYLIADLEWLVMPPVLLRQFRLFYHEGKPAGVVLWAKVSAEVEARLAAGAPSLRAPDWRSGERFRVIRTVAPFGGGEAFAAETEKAVAGSAG